MPRLRVLALLCSFALSACGAPQISVPLGDVTAANFGDRKPFDWPGQSPDRYAVHGIDVARFQDPLNWGEARVSGVNFAFIKATEGGDLLDPMFQNHWDGAGRAGVARGAYHFYYFCTTPEKQARWFIENVPKTAGMLPPVLDLEWNPFSPTCTLRPPADTVRRNAQTFLSILRAHYGQQPVVYTTPEFYAQNDMGRLRDVEFWLRSTAAHPSEKYPNERWTFWQYTSTGRVTGAQGDIDIDINVYAGSPASWENWLSRRQVR
ncbi:MAG: glycoside hydrolase family 25 protein [Sulfitobacter litoralis]|jgi:lysozyme|uniref:glycoside hydrolase family 25 protein n=1 Tax=Sulfitobacter TaxID=60136 RepID=UPI001B5A271D|nr:MULTISPECIES: glycoside hydrolase family 25 protein [Sulfitobacter]MBQ0764908.1 glycoside hydrolase family 25 protein [Sulfitobacter litoralis]MCF7726703.1 glycoside hydrolase [Sulfitobacter sp. M22]MCF7778026.1 glycoside hydrolase [Sulfitobacter sp. M220]|tara:strand:- start:391 stop:1179 length:789 start_codon:yes stop_codon:yes gene_type:complete